MSLSCEQSPDAATNGETCEPSVGQKQGRKTRLLSLTDLDQRTVAARTVNEMRDRILADLGGEQNLSEIERGVVDHLALDAALHRDLSVRWLKGEEVDVATIATIQNAYNRSAAIVGTKRRPRDLDDLQNYLASKRRLETPQEVA